MCEMRDVFGFLSKRKQKIIPGDNVALLQAMSTRLNQSINK